MDTFSSPDGVNYFALCLKDARRIASAAVRDVVVVFNTSASQTGDYRAKAVEALKGALGRPARTIACS